MSKDYPRQGRDHRLGSGGLHRRDLCRARHAGAGADPGRAAGRPAHHHHRRGELSGLCRRHPGPLADGADAEAGRARRHPHRHRSCQQGGAWRPAVPADLRLRRRLSRRQPDHRHRRAGALARSALRAEVQRLRRVGLRHLRRLLLSQQGSGGDRRRQYRGRGSAVPDQFRLQGHRRAPARRVPRGKDPAGPAVQEPEDRRDLGHRARRRHRQRKSAQGQPRAAART